MKNWTEDGTLIKFLRSTCNLSKELHDYLGEIVKEKYIPKKSRLLRPGQICQNIYFVEEGILRTFYDKGDNNITSSFSSEGDICVSLESFITQKPGIEGIEALEDCTVLYISYEQYQLLNRKFPDFSTITRLLLERCIVFRERRMAGMWMQTSINCYNWLLREMPYISQRVAGKHIASYLGITEEMLSRNRSILYRNR